MPLSDHEQRLLEQMEQALYAEDPRFASVLQGEDLRVRYRRRLIAAVLGFLVGIAMLMSGLVLSMSSVNVGSILVSVLGFVVMLVAVLLGVGAYRRSPHDGQAQAFVPPSNVSPISAGRRKRGLMERVEERWQRRRDES